MEHLNLFSEKPVRIDNDDMWLSFVWHPENVHKVIIKNIKDIISDFAIF